MREKIITKPIFDIKTFTRNFQDSLTDIWQLYENSK